MRNYTTLLIAAVALLSGSLIYVLFRADSLRMFSWFESLGLSQIIELARTASGNAAFPDWLVFALPDGLWIFSYSSVLLWLWRYRLNPENLFWISIMPVLAIGSELGQLLKLISGTFDYCDMIMYTAGTCIPFLIFKKQITFNLKTI